MTQGASPYGRGGRSVRIECLAAEAFESWLLPLLEDPLLADLHVLRVEANRSLSRLCVVLVPGAPESARAEGDVQNALSRAEPFLRRELAAVLPLKRTPSLDLRFLALPLHGGEGGAA